MSDTTAEDFETIENSDALPNGTLLDEYEICGFLGRGTFGLTYLAYDALFNDEVAIKEYLPTYMAVRLSKTEVAPKSDGDKEPFRQGVEKFLEEARVMALFKHPNIVQVRRFLRLNGTAYIVMKYEGDPLSKIAAEGPIPNGKLRAVLLGALSGLEEIHKSAHLHRDIKPSNIVVRSDGSPVLIDFGAAREFLSRQNPMTTIYTPGFAPPEQFGGGEQGPWTDFYALGATAYHCVTGKMPDHAVPAEKAGAGRYDAPLLKAIDWMLRLDTAKRPQTAADIRDALKRNWIKTIAVASLVAFIIAGCAVGGYFWYEGYKRDRETAEMQDLAKAGYDRDKIAQVLARCAPNCAPATKSEAEKRLALLDTEAEEYHRARGGRERLVAYVQHCVACEFRDRAAAEAEALEESERNAQRQRLADALDAAGFDRVKLHNFVNLCGPQCPSDLAREAQGRLDLLDAEEKQYRAALDDVGRLQAYVQTCRACEFKDAAKERLAELYRKEQEAAGFDREKIEALLALCGTQCPEALLRDLRARLDIVKGEEAQYKAIPDDIARLENYVRSCRACTYKDETRRRLADLYAKERLADFYRKGEAAGFDRDKIESVLTACGTQCPEALRRDLQARLDTVKGEEAQYRAIPDDIGRLEAYVSSCRVCAYKDEAKRRLTELYAKELDRAAFDRAKLKSFIAACGTLCPSTLARRAQSLLDLSDAEKAKFDSGQDNVIRLQDYLKECVACEYREETQDRLAELYSAQLRAAGTNRAKLSQFLADCGSQCPTILADEARRRLNAPVEPQYRALDNRDVDGDVLRSMKDAALENCLAACTKDQACKAYTFDKWNHVCYLKSSANLARLEPKAISGIRTDTADPPESSASDEMSRYRGKNFPGDGYRTIPNSSFDGCETTCQHEASCVAFTFHKSERTCRLFRTTGEYFPDDQADSGAKRQLH